MADYSALVNQYLDAFGVGEAKKAEVAATSDTKKAAMGAAPAPLDFYKVGAGNYTGKGMDSAGQLEIDARTLTPYQLNQKYGYDVGAELTAARAQGSENFRSDFTANRSPKGSLWDTTTGIGLGFVNGLAGVGSLGVGIADKVGLAPDGSGAYVADKIGDANAWAQSKQSSALNDRRQAGQAVQGLDERDHKAEYEQTKDADGKLVASLRRIGKDALSSVGNTFEDPMLTADGVMGGVGSLFGGGVIGKGLKVAGEAAAVRAAVGATGPSRAAAMIAAATEKAAMPVAIGALEAGGAHQQTADQAMKMGATPEEANNAGLLAAAIQAPVAVATGSLVSKFEGNPLHVGSIKSAVADVAKETVEEGIQSGAGQAAQNYGLKTHVDPNQDLADGVGAQAGQGAMFGFGTAGVLQAPGIAGRAAIETGKGAVGAVKPIVDALMNRGERISAGVNAAQAQAATAAQNAAVAAAPEAQQALKEAIQAKGLSPEQTAQQIDHVDQVFQKMAFDPAEAQDEAPVVKSAVEGASDRFTALRQVAQVANDPGTSEVDRAHAGAYLLKQYTAYEQLLYGDLGAAIRQVDDSEGSKDPNLEHLPKLFEFEDTVMALRAHPEIEAALAKAQEATSSPAIQEQFSDKAMSTPEGQLAAQQSADAVLELANVDPAKADPDTLDLIRKQASGGRLNLTPEQRSTVVAASALVRATRARIESLKDLGLSSGDQVSYEVQGQEAVGDPDQHPVQSGAAKYKAVMDAVRAGDLDTARLQLRDLALLAKHFQNKVQAYNANLASGNSDVHTSFEGLSKGRKLGEPKWTKAKPVFLQPRSVTSVKNAQNAAVDAKALVELTNGLATAFPQLGVQSISPVSLSVDPNLERKAADVVEAQSKARNTTSKEQVNSQKVAEEKPSATVEVAPDTTQDTQTETKAATEVDQNQQPLPFEEPVTPLKEAEQPQLPLAKDEASQSVETSEKEAAPQSDAVVSEAVADEPFTDLLGSTQDRNWFRKAFSLPKVATTRIRDLGDQVLATISAALKSDTAFEEFVGSKLSHTMSSQVIEAYSDLLASAGTSIPKVLQLRLAKFLEGKDPSKAKADNPMQQWRRGKVLNLVEDRDGKWTYHPELLQAATLAGLQWLINTATRPGRELDAEAVAKILGIDENDVDEDQLAAFSEGLWLPDAVESLAAMITQFWGVRANNSAPLGYTKGIAEGMAKEVLIGLEASGYIRQFKIDATGRELTTKEVEALQKSDEEKTYNRVSLVEDEKKSLKQFNAFPGAIEQAVLTEAPEHRFIGKAPTKVARTQIRNRFVETTGQQRKVIQQRQNTPHRINEHMVGFLEGLGKDLVLKLFGAGEVDENVLNTNHARSLKGTNTTVGGAYDALISMLAEVRSKIAVSGEALTEVPIFYEYGISKVGRLQMQGLHNPQASKLMREAILPTRVTLDLTEAKQKAKFMLAVAQAWGVKVHKQPRNESVNEALGLASGRFAPALDALTAYLERGSADADLVDVLKEAFGDDISPAAIHAAMEYARFKQAKDPSAFVTDLYVEADGVTDGPINALVHLATGPFTDRWVQLVAKGGLFLGKAGMTVNSFVHGDVPAANKVDLYETTTETLKRVMKNFRQQLSGSEDVTYHLNAMLELMDGLLGKDLDFQDGKLEIRRGLAKNPLTVTIYGSGAKGIANKIVGALTESFYQELSKAAQGQSNRAEELKDLIDVLTNQVVRKGKEGYYVKDVVRETDAPKGEKSNLAYTLSKTQVDHLAENVQSLFVGPLRYSIEHTISDTETARNLVRDATQIQSIVLVHEFKRLVSEREAEKKKSDPLYKQADFLSQADLDGILEELKPLSPLLKTGGQILFPAGTENTDVKGVDLSRSLLEEKGKAMFTAARIFGPKRAGVAGIPFLVIGSGDGQMMLNLFSGKLAPKGALDVFDGVHIKLDTLDEDSRTVNQSVYDGWQNNPLSGVDESFKTFLANVDLSKAGDDLVNELSEMLEVAPSEEEGAETDPKVLLQQALTYFGAQVANASQLAQARHNALARVQMSVDHMASAESPFQSKGESLEGMSDVAIAERLNVIMEEELAKIREAGVIAKSDSSEPVPADAEPVTETAPEVQSPSVIVTPATGLLKLVRSLKIPAEQKNLLLEVAKALRKGGWQVIQDTKVVRGPNGEAIRGQTNVTQQKVFVFNNEPETLLHELLHATTTQKILDHYEGKSTPEVAEAIRHLETLMTEWRAKEADIGNLSADQRRAYNDALNAVEQEENNPDRTVEENKAAALDEFLAWNLSNQELIKLAQGSKVESRLARVVKRVLVSLKNLIWGRQMAPMVRSDMYSALRFNASVLINSTPSLQSRAGNLTRFQSQAYGQSNRLTELTKKLDRKINAHLNAQPVAVKMQAQSDLATLSTQIAGAFMSNGFPMNGQELGAFSMMLSVLATQAKLDPASMARVQAIYAHVNKTMVFEDFLADRTTTDQNLINEAQKKLQLLKGFVNGKPFLKMDGEGRSTLLPAFLALAAVNDEFRAVLSRMPVPKSERLANTSLDNVLYNLANAGMDYVSTAVSGEGRNRPNIQVAIDALTESLAASVEAQENIVSQLASPVSDLINSVNDKIVEVAQNTSKAAIDKLNAAQANTNSKMVKAGAEVLKAVAAIVNEEEGKHLAEGWISLSNTLKFPKFAGDFLTDLVGRTESNAPIYDMIKKVRSVVQQTRQQFREHLPGLIAQRFSRDLSKEEWGHMFKGLAKTDLAALSKSHSVEQILRLVHDAGFRASEIRRLEDQIEQEAGKRTWTQMQAKAQQLATFMNTGVKGLHLLSNAQAVAGLYGMNSGRAAYSPSTKLVGRVDQLVSLYALEGLEKPAMESLASLVQDEAEGVSFVMSYLVGQRVSEQQKLATGKAEANHYKGYIPSDPQAGVQLIVANDKEEARLRLLGYQRVGDYKGTFAEANARGYTKRGYYFAPLSGKAVFSQGIMQNVRQTASGVDPVTGMTHDGVMIAGRIIDPRAVKKIVQSNVAKDVEPLMPIFDADGEVIAYERSVDPAQEQRLNRDTHLARMIGAWRGRQMEESLAGRFNQILVENLHQIWDANQNTAHRGEFVNILDPDVLKKDPVLADAVKLFTPEALDHIKATFGADGFMVRKDMINDTVGYRAPSVGDAWTGNTRLPPEAVGVAKKLAIGVFGADAYRYLVTAEKLTQNLVSEARQLIVVKSVVVPISNFIANIYQMTSRGISLRRIARDIPKKLVETNAYVERRQRQIGLEAELRAAEGNIVEVRRISAELQSIHDANKRMSIWPLIEAGEFSSISDAGSLEKEETTLFEGRLSEYIEQQVNKLPPALKTAGQYALITHETALFQGMRRAMEYGDFLAKAVRYDHLVEEKKLDPTDALSKITEEYVNYDRLAGRFRQGLENIGLLWFWNFKVRIVKIALATIRENPLHALLTSLVPTPTFVGSIGTPLSDNLLSMAVDGDLGWSIGPGMGLRAPEMNPWVSLFG